MGKTQVYKWFNGFKRGEMSVEEQPHCGCLSKSRPDKNTEQVCQAVLAYYHQTIDKGSEVTGMARSLCRHI
jgi:hypothetical protein